MIDAALPAEVYLRLAQDRGWKITQVLETHIHADHLSRSRQLTEVTGATLLLPDQKRVSFAFRPVREGDILTLGGVQLTAIHTPGHTPESTCYLLDGMTLFTGDTLFLEALGRADLHASRVEVRNRARTLFRSAHRLLLFPPETLILPSHTGKPVAFDGKPICAPLGEVRARLGELPTSEEAFVGRVLARPPLTPPNYERIVKLNEAGLLPEGDPTELEAGANRCAIA